jgi:hypothetical protein
LRGSRPTTSTATPTRSTTPDSRIRFFLLVDWRLRGSWPVNLVEVHPHADGGPLRRTAGSTRCIWSFSAVGRRRRPSHRWRRHWGGQGRRGSRRC